MRPRRFARRTRGPLRWWLVYGPVRSGTTLAADLIGHHSKRTLSDWGLHAVLDGPLGDVPRSFDLRAMRRAVLEAAMDSVDHHPRRALDLVYKQANLRPAEASALTEALGPPERTIFCLRDPAGFMASALRKFPDVDRRNLQEINYLGTIEAHATIGGEVFVYHPGISAQEYESLLAPLGARPLGEDVVFRGRSDPDSTTLAMWDAYERLAANAVNRAHVSDVPQPEIRHGGDGGRRAAPGEFDG